MACIDREKVLAVLVKRFPGAPLGQVAAAANAIVGLEAEYDAVPSADMSRFDCEFKSREFTLRHVASGDVRVYYRTARPK
jgi:hypothetical protein